MSRYALKAYRKDGIELEIQSADPHKLVTMLFDRALHEVETARVHMVDKNIAVKCQAISRALAIVDQGLIGSLDEDQGGELAAELRRLYEHVLESLVKANASNDPTLLNHVSSVLEQLRSAWIEITPAPSSAAQDVASEPP